MTTESDLHGIAVPLVGNFKGEDVGGSGFLHTVDGICHLITCAHLFTGEAKNTIDWARWYPSVRVVRPQSAQSVEKLEVVDELPLFEEADDALRPRFRYLKFTEGGESLVDLIAIPLSSDTTWRPQYATVDSWARSDGAGEAVGEAMLLLGYPTGGANWPALESAPLVSLQTSTLESALLLASPGAREGFSGGPVLVGGPGIIGMAIGHTNDERKWTQIIPWAFIEMLALRPDGVISNAAFVDYLARVQTTAK